MAGIESMLVVLRTTIRKAPIADRVTFLNSITVQSKEIKQ